MAIFFDGYGVCCACAREKCSYECSTYRSYKPIPVTNYDRIISKTPEELATWIDDYAAYAWCPVDAPIDQETHECWVHDGDCRLCILDWLRKEATE